MLSQDERLPYNNLKYPPYFISLSRYTERVNIEAHLFSLQTKRKGNNQRPYVPPEGRLVLDINKAWQVMESAEHDREMALRQELIR